MRRSVRLIALQYIVSIVTMLLSANSLSAATQPTPQFVIASDLHFNPFFDPAIVKRLAATPPRQWEPIFNRSKLAAYSQNHQDTNWLLLQSSLDAMHKTLPNPPLVMITGDLLAHNFPASFRSATGDTNREHYRAFVRKTVTFLGWELQKRFPGAQMLLTPGNNDDECGDYDVEADGPFLGDTAELTRKLARSGPEVARDWSELGSYSVAPRAIPGIRILSVNSVFFSNKYQSASLGHACATVDSTAAERTFTWLETELAQARAGNKKVWLMFHIPPGIDGFSTLMNVRRLLFTAQPHDVCRSAIVPMWRPEWTARFIAILTKYQDTIVATFAGHDHTDDFRSIPSAGPAGFVIIDPPISPIYGQNPSFRVVGYRGDGTLADHTTLYLTNLKAAGKDVPGEWAKEYSFVEEWKGPPNAPTLDHVNSQIQAEPGMRDRWLTLLNVSSADDKVPAIAVPALTCAIGSLDPESYLACYCPK